MIKLLFVLKICCLMCLGAEDYEICGTLDQPKTMTKIDIGIQCQILDMPNIYLQLQDALRVKKRKNIAILLKDIKHIPFDSQEHTILHDAINYGSKTVLSALLEKQGIRVNNRNNDGLTPLHLAVKKNNVDMVKLLLLDTRLKINKKSKSYLSSIDYAMSLGNLSMVSILLQDSRIHINERNKSGVTLLHASILQAQSRKDYDNYIKIIRLLLETPGIHVDLANIYGETPLHYACLIGNPIVVKLLLDYGANVSAKNYKKQIPIQLTERNLQCAQILKNAGSD